MRITKTKRILEHLQRKGHITSLEAIQLYGDTRLADTILRLRDKYDIATIMTEGKDRYGNNTRFAIYQYKGELTA